MSEWRFGQTMMNTKGFSLLELSIALLLVGFLSTGGMLLLKTWENQKKRIETLEYMKEVKRAVLTYARLNNGLPCADSSASLDGRSDETPIVYSGYLPYATLGVKPTDAWGRRLKYSISRYMDRFQTSAVRCNELKKIGSITSGWKYLSYSYPPAYHMKIYNQRSGTASMVPAVIVSGGAENADHIGVLTPTEAPEAVFDRVDATYSNYFSNSNIFVSAPPSGSFDDIVLAIEPLELYYHLGCGTPIPSTPP